MNEQNAGQHSEFRTSDGCPKTFIQDLYCHIVVQYAKFNGRAGASCIIPDLFGRILVSAQRSNSKSSVADTGFQVRTPKKKAFP